MINSAICSWHLLSNERYNMGSNNRDGITMYGLLCIVLFVARGIWIKITLTAMMKGLSFPWDMLVCRVTKESNRTFLLYTWTHNSFSYTLIILLIMLIMYTGITYNDMNDIVTSSVKTWKSGWLEIVLLQNYHV